MLISGQTNFIRQENLGCYVFQEDYVRQVIIAVHSQRLTWDGGKNQFYSHMLVAFIDNNGY